MVDDASAICDEKVDVYSFGICMWACLTRKKPYDDALHQQMNQWELHDAVVAGSRPVFDESLLFSEHPNSSGVPIPRKLRELVASCWSADPRARPDDFGVIAQALARIETNTPSTLQDSRKARTGTGWHQVGTATDRETFGKELDFDLHHGNPLALAKSNGENNEDEAEVKEQGVV